MGETAHARERLAPYCVGLGLDLGFGGDSITPTALTFDTVPPYTNVGGDKQIMKGDCRDLSMFCDDSLDYIYQSHLVEDFTWVDIVPIVLEWRRVLKPGGVLVNCNPDEPIYRAITKPEHYNASHKNSDFTLETFKSKVVAVTGRWEILYECPLIDTYSWHLVLRKV